VGELGKGGFLGGGGRWRGGLDAEHGAEDRVIVVDGVEVAELVLTDARGAFMGSESGGAKV
jgi:hypothetical protein